MIDDKADSYRRVKAHSSICVPLFLYTAMLWRYCPRGYTARTDLVALKFVGGGGTWVYPRTQLVYQEILLIYLNRIRRPRGILYVTVIESAHGRLKRIIAIDCISLLAHGAPVLLEIFRQTLFYTRRNHADAAGSQLFSQLVDFLNCGYIDDIN